jgi:uncharacterized protein YdaU (DUF1376 family)
MAQLWFKFWAKEYLADAKVRSLTYDKRGILQTLWAFAWEEGSIPADHEALGMMLGIPAKAMRTHCEWISRFFVADPSDSSRLVSPRLEMDREEADAKGSKARQSALQRWSKRNANAYANALPTDMQTQCEQVCVSHAGQGQGTEKESTPSTTSQGSRGTKAKKARVDDLGAQPPMEVLNAVGQIVKLTPKVDTDGREIRAIRGEILTRVQTILTEHPSATPEILVLAWENYLKTRPTKIKAPQYFFGRQEDQGSTGANWYPYAKAIFIARQQEVALAPSA